MTTLQFLTTGLVRSRPQQVSDSERPPPVFIVLYLHHPKRQNKCNFLRPASVLNYTPQKAQTPNAHNEILSRCFYSLRNFFYNQNQPNKQKRCSHKNRFKPGIFLVVISKPEEEESSVTLLTFATDHHVSVEGFCVLMICPTAHKGLWSWVRWHPPRTRLAWTGDHKAQHLLSKKHPGFASQSALLQGACPTHVTINTFVVSVAVNEPLREFVILFSTSFKFTLQTEANCFFFSKQRSC